MANVSSNFYGFLHNERITISTKGNQNSEMWKSPTNLGNLCTGISLIWINAPYQAINLSESDRPVLFLPEFVMMEFHKINFFQVWGSYLSSLKKNFEYINYLNSPIRLCLTFFTDRAIMLINHVCHRAKIKFEDQIRVKSFHTFCTMAGDTQTKASWIIRQVMMVRSIRQNFRCCGYPAVNERSLWV